jgi:hypothetical protein
MLLRSFTTVLSLSVALAAQDPHATPPAAPGGAAMVQTAQQQVELLLRATRELDAVAFWNWLPPSCQRDVEQVVHELAGRVDAKTYDRTAKLLQRFATVALDKQQFVFGNATVARTVQQKGRDAEGAQQAYAALFGLVRELASGELASVDGLREFDGRAFASRSGKAMLQTVFAFARAQGNDPIEGLDAMRVRTLGERDGEVQIEVKAPDRDAEVTTFVQVEGRWLPVQMARGWRQGMAEVREQIAAMPERGDPKLAAQAGLVLGMIEGFVKKLEDVESQQDFDDVLGEVMAMVGGGGAQRHR